MTLGFSSISANADASSTTDAFTASGSCPQVGPVFLSNFCQPTCLSQPDNMAGVTPCFLKSWNSQATPCASSHVRAFFTVLQFGMPYSFMGVERTRQG